MIFPIWTIMLTIRPTKMLARRLRLELPPTPPAVANTASLYHVVS
jgi:hypothetical protein